MRRLFFLVPILLLAVPALADDETAKVKSAVENCYRDYVAAASNKDASALADVFDEKAILMPGSREPVLGKTAIGEYYQKLFTNPEFVPFTLAVDWKSFYSAGDIAIGTSVFEGNLTRGGKQIPFRRRNLLVSKKQADGSWKIFRLMFDDIPAKK